MKYLFSRLAVLFVVTLAAAEEAAAHYHILLPETSAAQRDKEVTVKFQWGHPFEHQMFDTISPQSIYAVAPDGTRIDLAQALKKIEIPGDAGKPVAAFQTAFTPNQRGDYAIIATAAPIWMNDEKLFFDDAIKVVLHVQTQNGWDAATGMPFEIVPLTRPYGLVAGIVFQARILADGKGLADAMVEIERYNAAPPKKLPPDEQITRTVKSDPNGTITCSLTEPGWWCITAERDGGKRERDGKMFPVHQRTTFWVYVDEKPEK